jgi:hypothetical protein
MSVALVVDGETYADSTYMNTLVNAINNRAADTYNVLSYGAEADGVTDDGPAIQDAIDAAYAALYSDDTPFSPVTVLVPPGTYRIKTTIQPRANIRYCMYGAVFEGPITGYGRITSATAVPSASDVAGQTAGACFGDTYGETGDRFGMLFQGGSFEGFRYGFQSIYSWPHVRFEDQDFSETDICWHFYGQTQNPSIFDPVIVTTCHAGIVSQGLCIAASHPWTGDSEQTGDGLMVQAEYRQRPGCSANDDLDDWYEAAILRPDTATTHSYASGDGTYPFTGTFRKVSGRIIYCPNRSLHAMGSHRYGPINSTQCPRGVALVAGVREFWAHLLHGEAMFYDEVVNDGPPYTESVLVIGVTTTASNTGIIELIDGPLSGTGGPGDTGWNKSVDVVADPDNPSAGGQFIGRSIVGEVDRRHFTMLDGISNEDRDVVTQQVYTKNLIASPRLWTVAGGNYQDATTRYNQYTDGPLVTLQNTDGYRANQQLWAGTIPLEGGAQTAAFLRVNGATDAPVKGILDLIIERLDTGEMDNARYLVSLPHNNNATTLGANVLAGATTFTVAAATTNNFPPGSSVTLDGTEIVRVLSRSGQTITTSYPIVGGFTAGDTVVAVPLIVRTLTALANAWVTVSINSDPGFDALRILNNLAPIPVLYHGVLTVTTPYEG